MMQSAWMAQVPMDANSASQELVATILQGDAPSAGLRAADRLSQRRGNVGARHALGGKLRRTRARRRVPHDGDAGLPVRITMTTMKRGNFLLGALSGITVVANTDHVLARALADAPLAGTARRRRSRAAA